LNEEKIARELADRLISVHGDVRDLDEVIDEILGKKDERVKRRFATA
jgi:hypothetical protein